MKLITLLIAIISIFWTSCTDEATTGETVKNTKTVAEVSEKPTKPQADVTTSDKPAEMTDEVKNVLKKASEALNVSSIQNAKTIVQKAKISIANMGINGTITVQLKDDKIHIESQTASINEVNAYDGKQAWSNNISMGLRILEGAEKLNIVSETLPYTFTPEKFYDKIELNGKSTFNNAECYVLKSTIAGMDPVLEYIDAKTYLSHGEVRIIPSPMGKMKATTIYKEYKSHEKGFKYPSSMSQTMGPVTLEVTMQSIQIDVPVKDELFKTPED